MMKGFNSRTINASTFRETLNSSLLPKKSAVSIEGILNEYYFQTGLRSTNELVVPSYLVSSTVDPITKEQELYVAVGCNTREDGKNHRNPLNVVFVLDISGSMGSAFNPYQTLRTYTSESSSSKPTESQTILTTAVQVLNEAIKSLKDQERVGIVLFDDKVELFQPIRRVDQIDLEALQERTSTIRPRGGTNMEIGYSQALHILSDMLDEEKPQGYDNRIIFLTDAQPNLGGGEQSLLGMTKRAARSDIFTTFIGLGLDFNTDLVDKLTQVKGSNYFSVHSAAQFKKILNEDFNYIVTPLAFNAVMFLESEAYQIERVYGTPYDGTSDAVMKVDTVTASAKDERGSKGGVIILKLKSKLTSNPNPSTTVKLTLIYEDRNGNKCRHGSEFDLQEKLNSLTAEPDQSVYENSGIRKAILLVRYVNLMHQIIEDNLNRSAQTSNDFRSTSTSTSSKQVLQISYLMKQDLLVFISHFKNEMQALSDPTLGKELDILDKLRYSL